MDRSENAVRAVGSAGFSVLDRFVRCSSRDVECGQFGIGSAGCGGGERGLGLLGLWLTLSFCGVGRGRIHRTERVLGGCDWMSRARCVFSGARLADMNAMYDVPPPRVSRCNAVRGYELSAVSGNL